MASRGLSSKYSSKGLTEVDQKKVITTLGHPKQKSIGAIKIEERVDFEAHRGTNHGKLPSTDSDGDIPMIAIDDEEEVQVISNYVKYTRHTPIERKRTIAYKNMEEKINDLTPQSPLLRQTFLVLDTNFMLSHLNIVDALSKLHQKYHHRIVIPTTVIRELDGLKNSDKISTETVDHISGKTIGYLARWANEWIYLKLAESSSAVRGQKLKEVLDFNARKDDSILDCCLYLKEKEEALVILLSNDKNLCMKALTNEILTASYRKEMSAELIAKMAYRESQTRNNITPESAQVYQASQNEVTMEINDYDDVESENPVIDGDQNQFSATPHSDIGRTTPISQNTSSQNDIFVVIDDVNEACQLVFKEVQTIMLGAVDNCMMEVYGDDIDLTDYKKENVKTLKDCANEIIKRWISVYSEYFKRNSIQPYQLHGRGKKIPKNIEAPKTIIELRHFISYWYQILKVLYANRGNFQNAALEKIFERWDHIQSNLKS